MCGIFVTTRPELWRTSIESVLDSLKARGPDANGVWLSPSGRALLLHTRLAIVGLGAEGAQPSANSRTALTYNGEIYNYRSLANEEERSRPLSDTQVLHRLLESEGPQVCDRLRGMYAFAYWDETDGSLTVARDPWGIKPLYILTHAGGGVSVSSELPALLLHADGQRVDPVGVAQYVAFGHTGPDVTLFENIRKLAPGLSMTFRSDGSVSTRVIDQASEFGRLGLEEALEDSVEAHFVADVDVGVFQRWPRLDPRGRVCPQAKFRAADVHHLVPSGLSDRRGTTCSPQCPAARH